MTAVIEEAGSDLFRKWEVFWETGRVLDSSWKFEICSRDLRSDLVSPPPHSYWVHTGFIVDSYWVHTGFILGSNWVYTRFILVSYWVYSRIILGL